MRYVDRYDDDDDDDAIYEDVDNEIIAEAIANSSKNREEEVKLANKHLKYDLLDKSVAVCKNFWFWGLLPHSVKMHRIAETYELLNKLVGD